MILRDRFYTPQTAKAILSWRILLGIGVAAGSILLGVTPALGIPFGLVAYSASVALAMPRDKRVRIDPFAVQEPWRQFVQGAQRSAGKLHQTVEALSAGPVQDRLASIVAKLDHGLDETWQIARRGHDIDQVVHRLDPTALRSTLETLQQQGATEAIASVEGQLESVDRLKAQSSKTVNTLRLAQTRLDELVARAAEVSVGAGDTDAYEHDVEDLVVELEGLRQAVQETHTT
jgi:FtsZ-binding cell division protein ZapB